MNELINECIGLYCTYYIFYHCVSSSFKVKAVCYSQIIKHTSPIPL